MQVVVIIPTYNEKGNIGSLIDVLQTVFAEIPHDMRILVVDDNSPDGTAAVVQDASRRHGNIQLLTGDKRGLGAAYVRGIRYALDQLSPDAIIQMDADFSHSPQDIPRLVAELDRGYDFVIGSRWLKGGKIPTDWNFLRRNISRWGNLSARLIAGFYQIRDCTNGFRAIKADLLRRIDMAQTWPEGFTFLMSLLHQAKVHRAKIKEIPVEYVDRVHGESKLSLKDLVDSLINAFWIRFGSSATFFRFLIVATSGVFVNLGSLYLLLAVIGAPGPLASPLSIELSIISNFVWHDLWTFSGRPLANSAIGRFLRFNAVSGSSLIIQFSVFLILTVVLDVHFLLAQLAGIAVGGVWNYLLNVSWTWRTDDKKADL